MQSKPKNARLVLLLFERLAAAAAAILRLPLGKDFVAVDHEKQVAKRGPPGGTIHLGVPVVVHLPTAGAVALGPSILLLPQCG